MIIFSLNFHGFGGPTKIASLKFILKQVNLDVVFLQESLVYGEKEKIFFLQCLPFWNYVAIDPNGHSGGLLIGWNPNYAEFCSLGTNESIFLEVTIKDFIEKMKQLNLYAPYKDKEIFWQPLVDSHLLSEEDLIVGGDLNFTISSQDMWGNSSRIDLLAYYFLNIIQAIGLVYIQPNQMTPTWRNKRVGTTGQKYWIVFSTTFLDNHRKMRSWTINSTISDHNLICLQYEKDVHKYDPPFKFNSTWITDT
jgi:hypothetical protein